MTSVLEIVRDMDATQVLLAECKGTVNLSQPDAHAVYSLIASLWRPRGYQIKKPQGVSAFGPS